MKLNIFYTKVANQIVKFSRHAKAMHSVNSQSMKRRYKNIAGLTCYIQLNSKQTKRPPHFSSL